MSDMGTRGLEAGACPTLERAAADAVMRLRESRVGVPRSRSMSRLVAAWLLVPGAEER